MLHFCQLLLGWVEERSSGWKEQNKGYNFSAVVLPPLCTIVCYTIWYCMYHQYVIFQELLDEVFKAAFFCIPLSLVLLTSTSVNYFIKMISSNLIRGVWTSSFQRFLLRQKLPFYSNHNMAAFHGWNWCFCVFYNDILKPDKMGLYLTIVKMFLDSFYVFYWLQHIVNYSDDLRFCL